MVKLIWENKKEISQLIKKKKRIYQNRFHKFETITIPENQKDPENWENLLFWSENLDVLYYLLHNYQNAIDLVYIDPPFFSGTNYVIEVEDRGEIFENIAYFDHWNKDLDSYLQMMYERLILIKKLMKNSGLLFIHLDWHAHHYLKLLLDEIFGEKRFINEIIWYYYNRSSAGKRSLPRAHDTILLYSKSNSYNLNKVRIPRDKPRKQLKRVMVDGILKNLKDENGHVVYRIVKDKKLDDVWKIPCLQPASKEWTGFPTQKHHFLIKQILQLASKKGDLIADFFCGSGTTLLVADRLERKWIGCDISKYSIYLTRNRLKQNRANLRMREKKQYPIGLYSVFSKENKEIIDSRFFDRKISIKRKK